jgi:hypothetical protein
VRARKQLEGCVPDLDFPSDAGFDLLKNDGFEAVRVRQKRKKKNEKAGNDNECKTD